MASRSERRRREPASKPAARLLRISSAGDRALNDLEDSLHRLQVACSERSEAEQRAVGERYAKFLKVLSVYTAFHNLERQRGAARRLVWVCNAQKACGGLADRIKGVAYALILAMLSRRVLLLDWWGRGFGEQSYLQPNAIDWRLTETERKEAKLDDAYEDYYYEKLGGADYIDDHSDNEYSIAFIHIFSVLGGIGVDIPAEDLRLSLEAIEDRWTWVLLGSNMEPSSLMNATKTASLEWIKEGMVGLGLDSLSLDDIDSVVGIIFRYLFRFSEEIPREVTAARGTLGLHNEPYVGVHVRTGFAGYVKQESVKHPKLYREPWQWKSTLSCSYEQATEKLGANGLIYLASDSNLVKNKTLDMRRFEGRVRSLDNTVVHLDLLEKTPQDSAESEREGVLNVWVELLLLAESHSLVRGDSGFAFLAQSLCFIPKDRTIDGLTCSPYEAN